jgi:putative transposase
VSDAEPDRHLFLMTIIQHPGWLYHQGLSSYREVLELLFYLGILACLETLRAWWIKFVDPCVEDLRHRKRRGNRGVNLVEVHNTVVGVRHWLWRAVVGHVSVLDMLFQRHWDTILANTFATWLPGECDVPEVIRSELLRSY